MKNSELSFYRALRNGDADAVRKLLETHPELIRDYMPDGKETWMDSAGTGGSVEVMSVLLDFGFNINALRLPEKSTALSVAIGFEHDGLVEFLLERGADPNYGRTVIGAINRSDPARRMKYLQLLVDHGADLNILWPLYGDESKAFTALDRTKRLPEVAEFLRRNGAKTAQEVRAERAADFATPATATISNLDQEIIDYFGRTFGTVSDEAVTELVPLGFPITVHIIPPSSTRNYLTLFTTGLAAEPMATPPGAEAFAWAELFVQLPGDWPYQELQRPEAAWPFTWLKKIARYPHENGTWLGGPATIVANDDPPRPLGPGVPFTSIMLLAEKEFQASDGRTIHLYRLTPLYTEERELELHLGMASLLRAFDRGSIPFVVDFERPNVAKTK